MAWEPEDVDIGNRMAALGISWEAAEARLIDEHREVIEHQYDSTLEEVKTLEELKTWLQQNVTPGLASIAIQEGH